MNRREFVRDALGGIALAATIAGAAAENRPGRRIPIGFLGASHSHALGKIKIAQSSPDWELVGVHEEDAAVREACRKAGTPLLPAADVLARAEVIAVESAVQDHGRHALQALRAGKHVHVEKPPSDNLEDVRAMTELARAKGLHLQSGYMWRNHPGFEKIFEAVRSGWLGEVFMIRAFMSNYLDAARRPEWGQFAGGAMFEQGSHLIDPIVRLLGRPTRITPFLRTDGEPKDNFKDNNVAVLEFGSAVAVVMNSSLHAAKSPARSFEVLGRNGTATLRPIEPPTLEIELVRAAGPYPAGRQTVPLRPYQRYADDLAELAAAVRGERKMGVGLDEELLVQEAVLRASGM